MTAIQQLGFADMLQTAAESNAEREFLKKAGHLPDSFDEGIPVYREILDRHDQAMLAGDFEKVRAEREEADLLICRLNGNTRFACCSDADSPGCYVPRVTAAPDGQMPLWGQLGSFIVTLGDQDPKSGFTMRVRVELAGLQSIGCCDRSFFLGFSAHAVDLDLPFLSGTGYRSFLGFWPNPVAGIYPDQFVKGVMMAHIDQELRGKPVAVSRDSIAYLTQESEEAAA